MRLQLRAAFGAELRRAFDLHAACRARVLDRQWRAALATKLAGLHARAACSADNVLVGLASMFHFGLSAELRHFNFLCARGDVGFFFNRRRAVRAQIQVGIETLRAYMRVTLAATIEVRLRLLDRLREHLVVRRFVAGVAHRVHSSLRTAQDAAEEGTRAAEQLARRPCSVAMKLAPPRVTARGARELELKAGALAAITVVVAEFNVAHGR